MTYIVILISLAFLPRDTTIPLLRETMGNRAGKKKRRPRRD